jgi:glycosyltransferase involved in cell wall biosynthesis
MAIEPGEPARPYLSVVIPMYNRAEFIPRAITSCLQSSIADFEVIVVDDGSTDGSAAAVRQMDHPAIRLVQHDVNRGLGATRNTGIEHARGEWVIQLDSDDELVDGALDMIRECAAKVPSDVAALWFRCRTDDGSLTPRPCPQEGLWTYEIWLSFCESVVAAGKNGDSEMLQVIRRSVHATCPYPEQRVPEDRTYFDRALRYRSCFFPTVLRLYHQDADNQMTKVNSPGGSDHNDRRSADEATDELLRMLQNHGRRVAVEAPLLYVRWQTRLAASAFRCGRQKQGLTACLKALARRPLRPRTMGLLLFGLFGSTIFHFARASRLRQLGRAR